MYALLGVVLLTTRRRRGLLREAVLALVFLATLPLLNGCAGAHPATTSTITITATSGALVQTATVQLTVQ